MSGVPVVAVVGAGVSGLSVARTSRAAVFEQSDGPGGICRSYYLRPDSEERLGRRPAEDDAYRFEVGGGHWIFGGDPETIAFLAEFTQFRVYERSAVVRLGSRGLTIPYPLQAHVDMLGSEFAARVKEERANCHGDLSDAASLDTWLNATFGATLCELFFRPFHDRYTAGLTSRIAPQDSYKSPNTYERGYNSCFRYPIGGLDDLVSRLGEGCDVRYGKRVVGIERDSRTLRFDDGTEFGYDRLASTLPLHHAVALAGLDLGVEADPHTSVLVLNVGAERGPTCPDAHWQYEPDSESGFHRLGFYSNVDPHFLPAGRRTGSHVSLYVERAFLGGKKPGRLEAGMYVDHAIQELQERGYLGRVEAVDQSWVDVAYTWQIPGSQWRERALRELAASGIQQVGRYARWHFQGIADSIHEGLELGRTITG
jgi:protoporphyrinogen oxidase